MDATARIAAGHMLMRAGVRIRRAAARVAAAVALLLLTTAAAFQLGFHASAPGFDRSLPPAVYGWRAAVAVAAAFLLARLAAVAIAAGGWLLFPRAHRELLDRTATRPASAPSGGVDAELAFLQVQLQDVEPSRRD
jgi:hypothetical protein